jgi:hypothetical protein
MDLGHAVGSSKALWGFRDANYIIIAGFARVGSPAVKMWSIPPIAAAKMQN